MSRNLGVELRKLADAFDEIQRVRSAYEGTIEEAIEIPVKYIKSTVNFMLFESESMDFREGLSKARVWIPKSEIQPKGHIPERLLVKVVVGPDSEPSHASIALKLPAQKWLDGDDIPF